MPLILKNGTFINWKTLEFSQKDIVVENGDETEKTIDCTGKYITKSFANGHHHIYSALARGMPAPKKTPGNFYEILKYIWWTLDKALDKDMIEASALTTAIACAKNGVTFVIDHHASPNFIDGSLEIIARAFDKVGIGHLLCYEITDRDGTDKAEKGLGETETYLQHNQGLIGLHASFTVSDDTMKKAAGLMEKYNSGIHIHVAEDLYDQKDCFQNYGKTVVERLNDFGILNSSKTILGHCLHLKEKERKILKKSKAFIVQNAESNLNNNVGYFNSKGLSKNIMFGTDGMHSDMLRSAKAAFFIGQNFDDIDFTETYRRFRNVHNYLNINDFKGDDDNNLIVLDYPSPTPLYSDNFLGHFIYGMESKYISHVISNGKLIVENKKVLGVDEEDVLKFSKKMALRLWGKL